MSIAELLTTNWPTLQHVKMQNKIPQNYLQGEEFKIIFYLDEVFK